MTSNNKAPITTFHALDLIEPIQRALKGEGYTTPTPIQAKAIPHLLNGSDLLGLAQTGTGKTAAFALPILQHLAVDRHPAGPRAVRALVLTPTRELAIQIGESFRVYGKHLSLERAVIFGGVGQTPQVQALARGLDILVATPGRLLDLLGQGHLRLDKLEIFVLDEADRMLDMGFINDIKKILSVLPKERQTVLFSATMPTEITRLADQILTDPVKVAVAATSTTADGIDQRVLFVERQDKRALLAEVLKDDSISRAIVFTCTKHGANRVAEQLERIEIKAEAIHGNKSQNARQRALDNFKKGRTRVLVATDIAARGIDIDGITHVINYDLPNVPESYVHRIGRTARAGTTGVAISFCDAEERAYLRDIEKLIQKRVPVVHDHPFRAAHVSAVQPEKVTPMHKPPLHKPAQGKAAQPARGQAKGGAAQPARTQARPAAPANDTGRRPTASATSPGARKSGAKR
jgi:ATP-dependent RNA helicase RhlE